MEPQEALELHAKFQSKLDNHIGGYDPKVYKNLIARIQAKLSPKEKKGAQDIMDILDALKRNGTIAVGNYEYLKTVLNESDPYAVQSIIEPFENQIKEILTKEKYGPGRTADYAKSVSTEKKAELRSTAAIPAENPKDEHSQVETTTDDPDAPFSNVYDIKPNQRGFLLILNVMEREREGSERDVQNLRRFFEEKLRFTVFSGSDLTLDEIDSMLQRTKNTLNGIDSNAYYCFVCVVMSHGGEDGILTSDNQHIKMDTIVDKFKSTEFKDFIGKPKIFLVQSCRGGSVQEIAEHEADKELEEEEVFCFVTALKDADILIAYATTDGYKSYRNPEKGSWFIRILLEVFQQYYNRHHLEEMLVSVRFRLACDTKWRVKSRSKDSNKQICCQMPCTWTTLTKLFFLKAAENI